MTETKKNNELSKANEIPAGDLVDRILDDIHSNDNSILKAIPDFIFVVSDEGIILDRKNSYKKLFPSIGNIAGLHLSEVFPQNVTGEIQLRIKEVLRSANQQSFDFQLDNSVEKKFFESRLLFRSYNEAIIVLRDITVQKTAELQVKEITEELKRLNSTKDKFFSIIGHDLRTPLNGLLGYTEILSTEINDLSKEEISEFVSSISEIARSVTTLLNNLLEWSLIQNGKIAFEPQKISICILVEKVFRLLHAAASKKQIQLINELSPGLELFADENMLYSIILNLVGNAIKFTHAGGYVKIFCTESDETFKLFVTDNGVGITETNIRKLLDADSSFSTSGTAKEKGTGLGITLCKEFIKKHKGQLEIESKAGEGTTFSFTISRKLPEQAAGVILPEKMKC